MTSASHAEGREFESRREYSFFVPNTHTYACTRIEPIFFDHTQELAFDTTDEKQQNVVLCDVARVVARELRCFYSDLYASQVEAAPEATRNTTEFFRDKWADGRNTVRAIANASRIVGSSKKLGA